MPIGGAQKRQERNAMYFSITETPEQKVWVTSDPHLLHEGPRGGTPLWESRGYNSPRHMTQQIVDTTNELVRENDILFMLGDLCLNADMNQLNMYLDMLRCQNFYCLWGNHNNPHEKQIYRPERDKLTLEPVQEVYPVRYKNMVYVGNYVEAVVNHQVIIMCHYPFMSWDKLGHGAWMLCGHEHGNLPDTRPESQYGKILDVGWDLYNKPLSFDDLKRIMDKKPIRRVGHH